MVLVARDETRLGRLAEKLGAGASVVAADVTEPNSGERIAAEVLARHRRIDVLVNSAGGAPGGSFWELTDEAWRTAYDVKVVGAVRMMRAVLPSMRAQRAGRILSIVGETGRQPQTTMLPGSAANAALLAVTKGIADEVAQHGVTVNALNPGPTRSPRLERLVAADLIAAVPMGRLAEPEEIARLAVVLVSGLAAHVTGTALTVDGGRTRAAP